jgi:benzoate/toluate 1,2-dioxygenase beta subunit
MITRDEAEAFLYLEARLMDTHAYDEWYALWTEDAHYWIPCNDDDHDVNLHISIVNENQRGLVNRIKRLQSGAAWAQDPPSRLSRVVGNVEHEPLGDDECVVRSTFQVIASRRGTLELVAGRNTHRLRRIDDGLRLVSKKVVLVDNDEVMGNLTFLI